MNSGKMPERGNRQPQDRRPPIRRARRRSFVGPVIAAVLLTTLVIVAIVVLFALIFGRPGKPLGNDTGTVPPPGEETDYQTLAPETTGIPETSFETEPSTAPEPVTEPAPVAITGYKVVTLDKSELFSGDLILVNSQYAYDFPEKKNTINVFNNKNKAYKLSSSQIELEPRTLEALNAMMLDFSNESGKSDVLVKNGYRSYEEQKQLFDARAASYGEENAKKYLAQPGHSEHHTGMCFDLGIYPDDGRVYDLDGLSGYADWFVKNCGKYGFILRYPENKAAITGITSDKWHFRYVGQVHAETMNELGLCLEEYLEELRKYPYNGDHLLVTTSSGKKYEIYYQYASDTGSTEVYVPENLPYTISGDNALGFVVTVSISG